MVNQREVLVYGDPRLKQRASEVEDPAACRELVQRMFSIMREYNGAGLAATQIGEMQRVFVWRVGDQEGVLINPELTLGREEETGMEGCLSVPGMAGDVRRALKLKAKGYDEQGNRVTVKAEGLLARVFQHEVDHLDGILFIERVEPGTLRPASHTEVTGI